MAGALACLLMLGLCLRKLNNLRNSRAVEVALIALTPMSLYLFGIANPSGWETATLLFFGLTLFEKASIPDSDSIPASRKSSEINMKIFFSALLAATARPISFVWVILLTLSIFLMAKSINRNMKDKTVVISVIPPIALGLIWYLTHRARMLKTDVVVSENAYSPLNLISYFMKSLWYLPKRLEEMWGVFGWLDTKPPAIASTCALVIFTIYFKNLFGFLVAGRPRRLYFMILISAILIFSIIESVQWANWPLWWQGRYALPFAYSLLVMGTMMLENQNLILSGAKIRFKIFLPFAMLSVYMVLLNYSRYAYGVEDGKITFQGVTSFGFIQNAIFWTFLVLILVMLTGRIISHSITRIRHQVAR